MEAEKVGETVPGRVKASNRTLYIYRRYYICPEAMLVSKPSKAPPGRRIKVPLSGFMIKKINY